jgi:hypothetical protein
MNSTTTTDESIPVYTINEYYVAASLSSAFAFICIIIGIIIVILIWRTKPSLHTVNHLLICNTCIASIVYCVSTINQYIYLIFIPWESSDMSCRWRAYFYYLGITGFMYSYMIQSISRFFFLYCQPNIAG